MKTVSNPAQMEELSQKGDRFAGIRNMLSQDINIFNPKLSDALQKANKNGHLNGEVPQTIRQIVELFVPTITSEPQSQEPTIRKTPSKLSRKQRKIWNKKNNNITISEPITTRYTTALEKVKNQVFDAVSLSREELRTLYKQGNHTPDSTLTRFDEKYHIRLLSSLSIPYTVFDGVDSTALVEYTKGYMEQKDHVETQYNYIGDMIKAKVIPLIQNALKAMEENPIMHYAPHAKYQMDIADTLKKIYEHGCFANIVPVQPGYIGFVFNNELKKANIKVGFKEFIGNISVHKFLNGIFAEVYGGQAINYFTQKAKEINMNIYGVSLDEETKKSLDFYAKSDEQYYIKMSDGTHFLQSVDFKSYANGEPSIFPISENDIKYQYRLPNIKQFIPAQLHSLPIHSIEFRVGVPSHFKGKLYTKSVFEQEFELLYQKYLLYISKLNTTNRPTQ